jgi:(1->4)-alpha-D-glucan 1-alpha-D-glucosylmutase
VDHPDGLRDPEAYFERLHNSVPGAWVVAEKILEPGETLRNPWKVAGTTGYDFLNVVSGLFVDPRGEEPLTRFYRQFTGETDPWPEVVLKSKELVLRDILGSDLNRLTAVFVDICERHRDNRDFTRHEIHHALREAVCCFPVYRTYVRAEEGQCSEQDVIYIDQALTLVKSRRPDLDPGLIQFLHSILVLETRGELESEFVMQFQQFTGPAMAKGVEDTAFYNFNRLVSLNEVGGDPGQFGVSTADFHAWCQRTERDWPQTMLATSTHDTKRGEDVRTRIHLLSGMPGRWSETVLRWAVRNEPLKTNGLPDRNTEYLLYQTLVGAWPIDADRLKTYMLKAVREAKRRTGWTNPEADFENALEHFVEGIMANCEFLEDARAFIEPLVFPGRVASLAQTLLKLTAPGIPDTYQGSEIWDLNLVDPDNRRPVNFDLRRRLMNELDPMSVEKILEHMDDGVPKLWIMKQALGLRERFGSYAPLPVTGEAQDQVVAFSRGEVAVIVPRSARDIVSWGETAVDLPSRSKWRNVLAGDEIVSSPALLSGLFRRFPVALLAGY